MEIRFTVSPDFAPERVAAWNAFGSWLGERLGRTLAFETFPGFASQRDAIEENRVDLIYATPFDAAMLVREKGFAALARARDRADEALVAVDAAHPARSMYELPPDTGVAGAGDPEVTRIGLLLLQAAELGTSRAGVRIFDTYTDLAEALAGPGAGVGIFLKRAFDDLPAPLRAGLRPLVASEIHVVHHQLMSSPRLSAVQDELRGALLAMEGDGAGRAILGELGFAGWDPVAAADLEFTIDLMETLFA